VTLSDLDKQALVVKSERIDSICLDLQKRLHYFVCEKQFSPLEFLLGCMQFAACGVVALSEDTERYAEFVELFGAAIANAEEHDERVVKAFWPDGSELQ
jgi:hypothetical protein